MVLHMLRRLVGDDVFFAGLRAFYDRWKFQKAGTDDFRQSMEKVSGRSLERFFETWVYGTSIPRVKFTYHVTGTDAQLRFEQPGAVADVPITVTIAYANGTAEELVVAVAERIVERTVALKRPVRAITANQDNAALVQMEK
jgi:aminopeptidase N